MGCYVEFNWFELTESIHSFPEFLPIQCISVEWVIFQLSPNTVFQVILEGVVLLASNCFILFLQAPAAFGLVSFLMHAGLERNRIRKHLLVFALAAPVMSMVTYLGLSKSSKEALSEVNATGVAMLFSAGTFLYVATVHVLPEVGGIAHSHRPESTGGKGLSRLEVAALVLGCLIPLVLSIGHHH